MTNARVSHWWRQMEARHGGPFPDRASLDGDRQADVVIVGGGYTGLWTAYELLVADPKLDVVILEAEVAAYGASGRNGGALVAQMNGSRAFWTAQGGTRDAAIAMERGIQGAVADVGAVIATENIDCGHVAAGVVMVARTPLEVQRFKASIVEDREWGFGEDDSQFLGRDEVLARIAIDGALGARFSSHCASVDGARLARGLADAVEARGGTIYERSPVLQIKQGSAVTASGTVTAPVVVRATEAYTESLRGERRRIIPIHTSMIATEPLTADQIEQLRWSGHEALLAEHPFLHLQFTEDQRITIGGDDPRVPYAWRSAPNVDGPADDHVIAHYRSQLVKLFPFLSAVQVADSWQGVFGTTKKWAPSVAFDPATGLASAGGYVGEGLAASNLAGRTLADLILRRDTDLTRLPWVNMRSRKWEPEPLRFIGAHVIAAARSKGDHKEARTDKPSHLMSLSDRVTGFSGNLG